MTTSSSSSDQNQNQPPLSDSPGHRLKTNISCAIANAVATTIQQRHLQQDILNKNSAVLNNNNSVSSNVINNNTNTTSHNQTTVNFGSAQQQQQISASNLVNNNPNSGSLCVTNSYNSNNVSGSGVGGGGFINNNSSALTGPNSVSFSSFFGSFNNASAATGVNVNNGGNLNSVSGNSIVNNNINSENLLLANGGGPKRDVSSSSSFAYLIFNCRIVHQCGEVASWKQLLSHGKGKFRIKVNKLSNYSFGLYSVTCKVIPNWCFIGHDHGPVLAINC